MVLRRLEADKEEVMGAEAKLAPNAMDNQSLSQLAQATVERVNMRQAVEVGVEVMVEVAEKVMVETAADMAKLMAEVAKVVAVEAMLAEGTMVVVDMVNAAVGEVKIAGMCPVTIAISRTMSVDLQSLLRWTSSGRNCRRRLAAAAVFSLLQTQKTASSGMIVGMSLKQACGRTSCMFCSRLTLNSPM
jgi:hypothetical protein